MLIQSRFSTPEVDCPSEEQGILLALRDRPGIHRISVDFDRRELTVIHDPGLGAAGRIAELIPFRATLLESTSLETTGVPTNVEGHSQLGERRVLLWLLGLNFAMFIVEVSVGVGAQSSGLVADGLDMLADSSVYLLSFFSVNLGLSGRLRATRLSAILQGGLGLLTLGQAVWRFIFGSEPEPGWMAGVSALALVVNVSCLILISRFRSGRLHMQASWIFSSNDVIANIAVIAAGGLVALSGSRYPDLLVGLGICFLVLRGAVQINRLAGRPESILVNDSGGTA